MLISRPRRLAFPVLFVALSIGVLAAKSVGAADCGTVATPQSSQHHPPYSGTLPNLLTTAGSDDYIYTATEWGFARATISASGSVGPLQLLQIGKKYVPGDNGGLIYMGCDCYQGASTFDAAEAPDGSSRMISDWVATASGVLKGMLGQTTGVGAPAFGDQLNINQVALGSNVAAVYHPASGKYFGYFPSNNGLQIVDLSNPNGSVDPSVALSPIGNFGWAGVGILKAGKVTVQGVPKILLAGYIGGSSTLRIAEVGSDGMPVEKASHASLGPNALYIANVNGKAYVFSADNASGLNVYEYTGSALNFAGNLPGYFNNVVVKGNPGGNYPAIILHRSLKILPTDPSDGVDIWDSKWLTAGTPQRAYTMSHQGGAPPTGRGNAIEAVVTGSGSQIIAHVFRLATTTNPLVNAEHLLIVDHIDVSCIAADTTSPPTANATFVNKSAQSRSGVEATINYYGDRFVFTDTSGTGVPITRVDWDLATAGNTQGDFAPDAALGITSSIGGLNGFVFPCDPSIATTDPTTGFNCRQSLALPATPGAASFKFGEKSSNVNGPATNAFFSAGIPFQMPAAKVANMVGGNLSILTGGSADATPSQGHPIGWHWTFSGGSGGSSSLPVAPVPNGTTSFSLALDYEGGYSASTNGNVVITDLVPAFSMNPSAVGLGLPVTLTNTMQIATGAVVTSVDSSVVAGTCPGAPNFTTGPNLQSGFLLQGGTSPLTAPGTAGTYCVTLQYHYTPAAGVPTISPAKPFQQLTVANALMTGTVTGPSTGSPNQSYTFTANITGGVPPLSYAWDCNYSTFSGGNWGTPSQVNTTPCSWGIGGGHSPGVRVTDSAVPPSSSTFFTSITLTGGGGGSLSASVSGPSSGSVGNAYTFFASAAGGQGGYSFAWACDYTSLGGSGQFVPGQQSNACTYSSNGSRVVAVRVTDSASASANGSTTISIGGGGGPGPGGLSVGVTGPSTGSANSALTYTAAASGGTPPYTYAWACDYSVVGGSGQFVQGNSTKACTFSGNGVHVVAARVTDAATNSVQNTASTNIAGLGLPSVAFTVTGATMSGGVVTVGLGQPVTFLSSEPNGSSWGWDFGDTSGGTGRSITKTYPAKGTFTGTLIVTGNGTGASGQNIGNFTINVVTPPPSGAFTITGAQSNGNGTVFTANVGDQLTLTAQETHAISYSWDFGDSTSAVAAIPTANKGYAALGSYTVRLFVVGDERNTTGTVISTFTINVVSCAGNATTLCVNDSRFRATVNWAVPDQSKSGSGNAVVLTADTGYYWFFSPTNIELVLKVVDGRAFNGNFWVFYGALSDVQYDITIKDTSSGLTKTYHNPYHTTASVADVDAFPGGGSVAEPAKKTLATSALSVQCTPSTVTVGQPITCTATPSGTYSWDWGAFPPSYAAGPNPNTHTFSTAGTQRVTVTTDNGITTASTTVAVTAAGSGGIVPAISGPSTGTTASALSYDGSATGGTPPYSYAWNCDYSALNPSFTAGTQSNPCTYTAIGLHTIGLKVTDSATPAASATTTTAVTISAPAGPGLPSAAYTVSGATLNPVTNRYEAEVGRPVTFTATETNAASWGWAFGDGASAGGADPSNRTVTYSYPQLGSWNGQLIVTGDTTHTVGLNIGAIPISVLRCAAGDNTLCLNGGRFKVQVAWRSADSSGVGTAVPVTADTGQFWFITSNNIELVIKVVDGTSFNGHYWVFYGALSNLEYDITVTDTTTGSVKTYHNPLGTTASLADVEAF